ncbi:YhcN/YlaJ family sporulation lipoprotein [Cytobacillus sp. NCCP-133]|uniref:YhcN/YlaJ family sporulation lipoprotein n=1 Tax=Cytobacillus sp. NCCP-133 TaxID=766848 RepID=UPI00223277CF|nr:YhcN/YlaJ family sporulation lipoprotein [Cytobacillus sp. NCCP-133]GLB59706.1 putative lipoprotein YutC [Cytobacillus sp. NCCP-133]
MKKPLIILGIFSMAALTACQNNAAREDIYEESGNTINVNDQRAELYNRNMGNGRNGRNNVSEDFGYVRHQRSPIMGENASANHYAAIDREQIADIIGQYCTEVPSVDDVSTLVTDEEVLIVYDTDTENRSQTADQVKKMAMSVVPRWYHVYVSDDTSLRKNVENFATVDSDGRNAENGINQLIKQMLKSPQGEKMSESENENGEMQGERNDVMDKDDLGESVRKAGNQ